MPDLSQMMLSLLVFTIFPYHQSNLAAIILKLFFAGLLDKSLHPYLLEVGGYARISPTV